MEIHPLPEALAAKIAAGEVIERPLSVVKELIENSLDAGASTIEIELVQGGKVLISVRDNGKGISPDELPLAVQKHATSKISTEGDLSAIMTLGYRGEALYSMGAVSHLEIYSRRKEREEGASLRFSDSGEPLVSPSPLRPGTTVIVKDLFYNLPARRKFMKTAAAEFRRILVLIQDYAAAYPAVTFSLVHGGKKVFRSPGSGRVEDVLKQLLGEEPEILHVSRETEDGKAELWWQDSGPQSRFQLVSFVNGRRISDGVIRSALQSFHWATRGSWVVMLTLPPDSIDVNVHPAKAEILFRHSGDVFDLVHRTAERFAAQYTQAPPSFFSSDAGQNPSPVSESGAGAPFPLPEPFAPAKDEKTEAGAESHRHNDVSSFILPRKSVTPPPCRPPSEPHPFSRMEAPFFRASSPSAAASPSSLRGATERLPFDLPPAAPEQPPSQAERPDSPESPAGQKEPAPQDPLFPAAAREPAETAPLPQLSAEAGAEKIYLGQIAQGYLVFSCAEGLLIVDPHAAHERVNFERILKACAEPGGQERLIMPVPLPPTLRASVLEHRSQLESLGFVIEDDGSLSGLPMHAKVIGLSPVELLRSAVNAAEDRQEHSESLLNAFATKACKASVKLTSRLEPAEARQLMDELEQCAQPNACPHGRPTALRVSGAALDKYFGRLGL